MAEQGLTLEQQLRYLEVDLLKLRAENTRLRKTLQENGRHGRRVQKAYEDALLLATWWAGGILPSRRYAKLKGMSQNRWENATALLKLARFITRQRHWTTAKLAVIEQRLETARERATADPALFFCVRTATANGGTKPNSLWWLLRELGSPKQDVENRS